MYCQLLTALKQLALQPTDKHKWDGLFSREIQDLISALQVFLWIKKHWRHDTVML